VYGIYFVNITLWNSTLTDIFVSFCGNVIGTKRSAGFLFNNLTSMDLLLENSVVDVRGNVTVSLDEEESLGAAIWFKDTSIRTAKCRNLSISFVSDVTALLPYGIYFFNTYLVNVIATDTSVTSVGTLSVSSCCSSLSAPTVLNIDTLVMLTCTFEYLTITLTATSNAVLGSGVWAYGVAIVQSNFYGSSFDHVILSIGGSLTSSLSKAIYIDTSGFQHVELFNIVVISHVSVSAINTFTEIHLKDSTFHELISDNLILEAGGIVGDSSCPDYTGILTESCSFGDTNIQNALIWISKTWMNCGPKSAEGISLSGLTASNSKWTNVTFDVTSGMLSPAILLSGGSFILSDLISVNFSAPNSISSGIVFTHMKFDNSTMCENQVISGGIVDLSTSSFTFARLFDSNFTSPVSLKMPFTSFSNAVVVRSSFSVTSNAIPTNAESFCENTVNGTLIPDTGNCMDTTLNSCVVYSPTPIPPTPTPTTHHNVIHVPDPEWIGIGVGILAFLVLLVVLSYELVKCIQAKKRRRFLDRDILDIDEGTSLIHNHTQYTLRNPSIADSKTITFPVYWNLQNTSSTPFQMIDVTGTLLGRIQDLVGDMGDVVAIWRYENLNLWRKYHVCRSIIAQEICRKVCCV
jgi:uncharacterized protein YjbI with pentapeptide repeats